MSSAAPGAFWVVAATFAVQAITAFISQAPGLYAPVAAPALGVRPESVGVFLSLYSIAGIFGSLGAPQLMQRFGPVRLCQYALLGMSASFILASASLSFLMLLCAMVIGFSSGLLTPPTAQLIARVTPPQRLSMMFAIKQTGVPLGFALCGVFVPLVLLALSWSSSLAVIAFLPAAVAAALQGLRPFDRERRSPRGPGGLLAPVRAVLQDPPLLHLALLVLVLSVGQSLFTGFIASLLVLELGQSLITAGLAVTVSQVAVAFWRLTLGWITDRTGKPFAVLAVLVVGMGVSGAGLASLRPGWPVPLIISIVVCYSVFALGWAGVYLGAVASHARHGDVGASIAGVHIFAQAGAVLGPSLMAGLVRALGSYSAGFLMLSALAFGFLFWVRAARRRLEKRIA